MQSAAIEHLFFHHRDSNGWLTLARKENDLFRQCYIKIDQLQDKLSEWIGQDVYFSQNTFYIPKRRLEYIRQLRALYCDLDVYNTNYTINQVKMALELDYYRQKIPEPNYIIHSGRGLVLIWLIEPVPIMALPRWQAVENYLVEQLKPFGADTKASDATRLFRLAGTTNGKNKKLVTVEYRHDYRYILEHLKIEYLPCLEEKKKKSGQSSDCQREIRNKFRISDLHFNRLLDLRKLVELRNYHMTGYREITLFLYRYYSCFFVKDLEDALMQTLSLNSEFTEPLPQREVIKATKSAERAFEKWLLNTNNGFYKRGGYNYTNQKLIELLDITPEEQMHLKTIISKEEKQRRNTIAKRKKRREQGVMERDLYIQDQKNITYQRLEQLKKILNENPNIKVKEIAEKMSISVPRVYELKRMLKAH